MGRFLRGWGLFSPEKKRRNTRAVPGVSALTRNKNGSMTPRFGGMTSFFKGHGDSMWLILIRGVRIWWKSRSHVWGPTSRNTVGWVDQSGVDILYVPLGRIRRMFGPSELVLVSLRPGVWSSPYPGSLDWGDSYEVTNPWLRKRNQLLSFATSKGLKASTGVWSSSRFVG